MDMKKRLGISRQGGQIIRYTCMDLPLKVVFYSIDWRENKTKPRNILSQFFFRVLAMALCWGNWMVMAQGGEEDRLDLGRTSDSPHPCCAVWKIRKHLHPKVGARTDAKRTDDPLEIWSRRKRILSCNSRERVQQQWVTTHWLLKHISTFSQQSRVQGSDQAAPGNNTNTA